MKCSNRHSESAKHSRLCGSDESRPIDIQYAIGTPFLSLNTGELTARERIVDNLILEYRLTCSIENCNHLNVNYLGTSVDFYSGEEPLVFS